MGKMGASISGPIGCLVAGCSGGEGGTADQGIDVAAASPEERAPEDNAFPTFAAPAPQDEAGEVEAGADDAANVTPATPAVAAEAPSR